MTKRRLEKLVRDWQRRLGLEHWAIEIDWDHPPIGLGSTSEVHESQNYDLAILRFEEEWPTWGEKDASLNIVHELLHVHLRSLDHPLASLEGLIPKKLYRAVVWHHKHYIEQAVERLAQRIVEIAQ